jgi:hypothetical protein
MSQTLSLVTILLFSICLGSAGGQADSQYSTVKLVPAAVTTTTVHNPLNGGFDFKVYHLGNYSESTCIRDSQAQLNDCLKSMIAKNSIEVYPKSSIDSMSKETQNTIAVLLSNIKSLSDTNDALSLRTAALEREIQVLEHTK